MRKRRKEEETEARQLEGGDDVDGDLVDAMPRLQVRAIINRSLLITRVILLAIPIISPSATAVYTNLFNTFRTLAITVTCSRELSANILVPEALLQFTADPFFLR